MQSGSASIITCNGVKRYAITFALLLWALCAAGAAPGCGVSGEAETAASDANSSALRRGPDGVFMPKGDFSAGVSFFYVDLFSDNSEYMMLLQNLNANATAMSLSPYLDYTYRDNRSVGLRVKYTSANGGVESADLSMLSDDLSFSLSDIASSARSFQAEVFHRSYAPIDARSRFGVFMDISLGYQHTRTQFSYDQKSLGTYSSADKLKFAVHPGLMVFVTNSISTQVSIGIGGANYNHIDYISGGEVTGTRDFSRVRFMLDVMDIAFGLSFHL